VSHFTLLALFLKSDTLPDVQQTVSRQDAEGSQQLNYN